MTTEHAATLPYLSTRTTLTVITRRVRYWLLRRLPRLLTVLLWPRPSGSRNQRHAASSKQQPPWPLRRLRQPTGRINHHHSSFHSIYSTTMLMSDVVNY